MKRQIEENERQEMIQQEKAKKEKKEKEAKKKRREEDKEKSQKEKLEKEKLRRKQEEEQDMKKVEGRMRNIIIDLQHNQTARDVTIAGLKLGFVRCGLLATHIETNSSLMCLHMARKNIKDPEGVIIAKMLLHNKHLRKLELEGNLMGPNSAKEFGNALCHNKTLKFLDLENNQLANDQDTSGVERLIDMLKDNVTLLSLNLANNELNDMVGQKLEVATA